jgi:hypothetical protein
MKNLFNWRDRKWQKRAWAILTFVVLLMIISHPELRLLFPLIDALGIDVLLTLLSVQFISLFGDYVKPSLLLAYNNLLLPAIGKLHSLLMFLSGSFGHCITVVFFTYYAKVLPNYAIKGDLRGKT